MNPLRDAWETVKVKWLMMDAQMKQVVIVAGLYVFLSVLEIATARKRAQIEGASRV